MPLDQLWRGLSPTTAGYTNLVQNAKLNIQEGYYTGTTYEYITLGSAYIDSVKQNRGEKSDTLSIRASSILKKLRDKTFDQAYNYESSFIYYDNFDKSIYSDAWQSSGTVWSESGGKLIGTSSATFETIEFIKKTNFYNVFFEVKGSQNPINSSVYLSAGARIPAITVLDRGAWAFLDGTSLFSLQRRVGEGWTGLLTSTHNSIVADTDYTVRILTHSNRAYGFYSMSNTNFVWAGSTYGLYNRGDSAGMVGIFTNQGTASYSYAKIFDYNYPYSVNYLIKDIAYKAGIVNVTIPNLYDKSFTDLSGWAQTGGSWFVNVSTGVLTANGTSSAANEWSVLFTGRSFQDFRFDVDINIGYSMYAGIFVGLSSNKGTNFFVRGNSSGMGISQIMLDFASDLLFNGQSRYATDGMPIAVIRYPYAAEWHTWSMIKQNDDIRYLMDDQMVWYHKGLSGINIDSSNVVGLIVYGRLGTGFTASFRNFNVQALSNIVPNFNISPNSTAESAFSRLQSVADFKYRVNNDTLVIIPSLGMGDSNVKSYDLGTSQRAWDINKEEQDDIINHVIVFGTNNIRADVWGATEYNLVKSDRVKIITDETLDTYADCFALANNVIANERKDNTKLSFEMVADPTLEKYDVLTIKDQNTGVSNNYRITSLNKNYNPNVGDFTETIELEQA